MSEREIDLIKKLDTLKITIEKVKKIQNITTEEYVELFENSSLKNLVLEMALLEACALASEGDQQKASQLFERLTEQGTMAARKLYYEFT